MTSPEIEQELGHSILEAFPNAKVDVHKPDGKLRIEIRQFINIYGKIIPGLSGMPLGTNGKAMLLLSGGIDSPVAIRQHSGSQMDCAALESEQV